MGIKVTDKGIAIIKNKTKNLYVHLNAIREEKTIAYNNSGDTWHDNPNFKILEQEESSVNRQIQELENLLKTAELVELNLHNTETVQIGSIVLCRCKYTNFVEEVVYEIVGYGESDLDNGKISYDSPVAKHLMGLGVGEEASFETPGGIALFKVLNMFDSWESIDRNVSSICKGGL